VLIARVARSADEDETIVVLQRLVKGVEYRDCVFVIHGGQAHLICARVGSVETEQHLPVVATRLHGAQVFHRHNKAASAAAFPVRERDVDETVFHLSRADFSRRQVMMQYSLEAETAITFPFLTPSEKMARTRAKKRACSLGEARETKRDIFAITLSPKRNNNMFEQLIVNDLGPVRLEVPDGGSRVLRFSWCLWADAGEDVSVDVQVDENAECGRVTASARVLSSAPPSSGRPPGRREVRGSLSKQLSRYMQLTYVWVSGCPASHGLSQEATGVRICGNSALAALSGLNVMCTNDSRLELDDVHVTRMCVAMAGGSAVDGLGTSSCDELEAAAPPSHGCALRGVRPMVALRLVRSGSAAPGRGGRNRVVVACERHHQQQGVNLRVAASEEARACFEVLYQTHPAASAAPPPPPPTLPSSSFFSGTITRWRNQPSVPPVFAAWSSHPPVSSSHRSREEAWNELAPPTTTRSLPPVDSASAEPMDVDGRDDVPRQPQDCVICTVARARHAALPCNHLVACESCIGDTRARVRACPLCRQGVRGWSDTQPGNGGGGGSPRSASSSPPGRFFLGLPSAAPGTPRSY
jgi:hypothetical protein